MNRAVVVMLGALVIAAAASSSSQTEAPLIVAYMTSSDGELVPVARFDGTNWRNSWPEPIHNDVPLPVRTVKEIPRAWLGQPVPLTWMVWSQATGKHGSIWAMSEWGKESQTIVLFEVSARGVRKLTSADVSGC
jgi:hypothetical protein